MQKTLPAAGGEAPKLRFQCPGAHVWSWKNLYVGVFTAAQNAAMIRAMHDVQAEMAPRFGGDIGQISIVELTATLPDAKTREVMTRTMKESSTRAVAIVLRGTGFWLSAVRSALTALVYVVRGNVAMQFFGNVDDAVKWLCTEQLSSPPKLEEALVVARAIRDASAGG